MKTLSALLGLSLTVYAQVAPAQDRLAPTTLDDPPEQAPSPMFENELVSNRGTAGQRTALEAMSTGCAFKGDARMGPTPREAKRCDAAESKVVSLGFPMVGLLMRRLNTSIRLDFTEAAFDAIARIGDVRTIEPLIAALEKVEQGSGHPGEIWAVHRTLMRLTFAKVDEAPNFDVQTGGFSKWWQAWFSQHRGMSRDAMLQERLADARQHISDADAASALQASSFLAERLESRKEGLSALHKLAGRANLLKSDSQDVEQEIEKVNAMRPVSPVPLTL